MSSLCVVYECVSVFVRQGKNLSRFLTLFQLMCLEKIRMIICISLPLLGQVLFFNHGGYRTVRFYHTQIRLAQFPRVTVSQPFVLACSLYCTIQIHWRMSVLKPLLWLEIFVCVWDCECLYLLFFSMLWPLTCRHGKFPCKFQHFPLKDDWSRAAILTTCRNLL